jgi:hypothetical protein
MAHWLIFASGEDLRRNVSNPFVLPTCVLQTPSVVAHEIAVPTGAVAGLLYLS